MKHIIIAFTLLANFASPAMAEITNVQGQSSPVTLISPSMATYTINWRVTRSRLVNIREPQIATVSSAGADLLIAGRLITVGGGLTQISDMATFGPSIMMFNETITLDRSQIFLMGKEGPATVSRTFSDSFGAATASVTLMPVESSPAVALDIDRIELMFEDQSRAKIVHRFDTIAVIARINHEGSGVGRFEWQVAGPISSGSTPVYRALQLVTIPLSTRGEATIESPTLPTEMAGAYLVRLVSVGAVRSLTPPVIRYFALASEKSSPALPSSASVPNIGLSLPAVGANIESDTQFTWLPVYGASFYALEFFTVDPDQGVLAGKAVSTATASAYLKSFTYKQLIEKGAAFWRVSAINSDGIVIARSELRKMKVSGK